MPKRLPPEFFDIFYDIAESGLAQMHPDCGGFVPEIYDLMEGDFEDDIPHIVDLALEQGGPVVDLGCGTGRLTIPLLKAGLTVYGLESDPRMLEYIADKISRLPDAQQKRFHPVQADMRDFSLPQQASTAVCSTNTFLYLGSQDDQKMALESIHQNLSANGVLWLDVFVPKPNPSAEEPYLSSYSDAKRGIFLLYCAQARENHFEGYSHVNAFTILWKDQKSPQVFVQSWKYSWITPNQLTLLLNAAGFEIRSLMGDYTAEPADDYSVQMIAIAGKVE